VFGKYPVSALGPPLSRMAAAGVLCAAATGLLLFSVRPIVYAENPAFQTKLLLVGAALAHALILRAGPAWRRALADGGKSSVLKAQAFLSLLLWAGAVLAGRWIGFLQ
jgi:divalent metal cation (Fe/Co/Zn/Cd) transporter